MRRLLIPASLLAAVLVGGCEDSPPPKAPSPAATAVVRQPVPDLVKPTVDCSRAFAPTEKLLCSDDELKLVEQEMAAAYARMLVGLPAAKLDALRLDHVAWYKDYTATCDAIGGGEMLKKCIFEHLSNRTHELDERPR
jgi:uncharacterized protein YecT (DUF1311 family)